MARSRPDDDSSDDDDASVVRGVETRASTADDSATRSTRRDPSPDVGRRHPLPAVVPLLPTGAGLVNCLQR